MIRRDDVTDIAWVLVRLEMKCLVSNQHFTVLLIWSVISQLSILANHKQILGQWLRAPWNYTCCNLGGAIFE